MRCFPPWGGTSHVHWLSHEVMCYLIHIFVLLFNKAADDDNEVDLHFQWNAIIDVFRLVHADTRISEDLMNFLLQRGYYEYFMSCHKKGICVKKELIQKVFSQFTQVYELIDIFIFLFNSNSVNDRQERNVIRRDAVSKVFNMVGEVILKHKNMMKFLTDKGYSLSCRREGLVKTDEIIQVVSSQFKHGMKKLIEDTNKASKTQSVQHVDLPLDHAGLDHEMCEHFLDVHMYNQLMSLDDAMNKTF